MQVKQQEGYVGYRQGLWFISHIFPLKPNEATNAVYSGFVCDMPKAFQKVGKEFQFTGNYYHAYKHMPETPLCI
jgi:hypothetical protein